MIDKIQSDETQKKAYDLARKFMFAKTKSEKWRRRGYEAIALANNDIEGTGTQLTQAELNALKKKYGIPLSINIIQAIIENLQAFISNAIPTINVIPVGKSNKAFAYIWREICNGTLYFNKFKAKQRRAIKDYLYSGLSALHVRPSSFFDQNEFNCVIQNIPWYYLYIDPNSIEPDFKDAEYIIVAYPMPASKAKKIWNLTDEQIKYAKSAFDGDFTSDGGYSKDLAGQNSSPDAEPNIWIMEAFEKEISTLYIHSDGSRSFNKKEESENSLPATYVKRTCMLGRYIQSEQMLGLTEYPFAFYTFNHNYNPMPYGGVHLIADIQYAVNRFVGLMIENLQKGGNFRWTAPTGSVSDPEKFEEDASRPGALLEYDFNPEAPDGGRPKQELPMPLPNQYITIVQLLIELSKYITGVFDLVQGNAQNAPNTLGATQSIQAAGTQRPKMYTQNTDEANQTLLEIIIQYLQCYSPYENIFRYVESSEGFREIITDVRVRMENGKPVQDEAGQELATFAYNEASNQVAAIFGSIKAGQYRVHYQSSNNTFNSRQAALRVMETAISGIADDSTRIVLSRAMLELVDYPEVDKVLRDTDVLQRANSTIEQLQQKLDELQKQNEALTKDNQDMSKDEILREFEVKLDKIYNKLDSEVKSEIKSQKEKNKKGQQAYN